MPVTYVGFNSIKLKQSKIFFQEDLGLNVAPRNQRRHKRKSTSDTRLNDKLVAAQQQFKTQPEPIKRIFFVDVVPASNPTRDDTEYHVYLLSRDDKTVYTFDVGGVIAHSADKEAVQDFNVFYCNSWYAHDLPHNYKRSSKDKRAQLISYQEEELGRIQLSITSILVKLIDSSEKLTDIFKQTENDSRRVFGLLKENSFSPTLKAIITSLESVAHDETGTMKYEDALALLKALEINAHCPELGITQQGNDKMAGPVAEAIAPPAATRGACSANETKSSNTPKTPFFHVMEGSFFVPNPPDIDHPELPHAELLHKIDMSAPAETNNLLLTPPEEVVAAAAEAPTTPVENNQLGIIKAYIFFHAAFCLAANSRKIVYGEAAYNPKIPVVIDLKWAKLTDQNDKTVSATVSARAIFDFITQQRLVTNEQDLASSSTSVGHYIVGSTGPLFSSHKNANARVLTKLFERWHREHGDEKDQTQRNWDSLYCERLTLI